ncbi:MULTISPECIES: TIGR01777 family oxidoreductase [Vibrio]|uniref:TIGR01777 family oxidoreductase n=1 Tax=Vibrio TaxID=662 RepID=UPI000B546D8F|nr:MULTISPECIES: TIGR01777 family oxidoreductase [Vibrio]ASG06938.1 TIGR01777 family protein [Vibrio anguillarum]MBF4423860.1 TIGR01777 family protein [Vibrio anguillarum]NAX18000.1 TIGR01777 family protein [Vibrio sp. V22_P2S10T140]OXX45535.1 TIGR01777 family protein [Vibrio sp. V07_P2A8T137]OXX55035.1 TIGR01777 family protein [Vibrio sp. V10_P2A27P122]
MKILLTGGTGFIGKELMKQIFTHNIYLLTRDIERAKQQLAHVDKGSITYLTSLASLKDANQFDAIINLAGEPIADKRWSKQQKAIICASRWEITERLVELIHASTEPPSVFISGSAVGYYGDQQSHPFDETLHVHQQSFPHHVCEKWERIALQAQSEKTRVCLLRTGIVLASDGGALKKMLSPYRLGLGGPLGKGEQYMPWIHLLDMARAIAYLLDTPHAQGAFNLCAPHPVPNKHFSQLLAKTLRRPHILFTPKWVLNLAMGEAAVLLFDSIRAKPKKLTELGFHFQFSHLEPALKNILQHRA